MTSERRPPGPVPPRDHRDAPEAVAAGTEPVESDEVRRLLATAAGPPEPGELSEEPAARAAFVTAAAPADQHRPSRARRRVSVGVVAVAVLMALSGGLAAADVLPAPAQRWVAAALDKIGLTVPSPSQHGSNGHPSAPGPGSPGVGSRPPSGTTTSPAGNGLASSPGTGATTRPTGTATPSPAPPGLGGSSGGPQPTESGRASSGPVSSPPVSSGAAGGAACSS